MAFTHGYYWLALVSGALTTLSFSPFEYYPVAWFSLAALFFVLSTAKTRRHYLLSSYLFGVGLFATGASWVFYSIHFYAYAPLLLALLMTSVFVLSLALLPLVFGWLSYRLKHNSTVINLIVVFPALWVLVEWLRSWLLTGFPWLLVAHGQIDTWLANTAPIAGELSVSWLTALVAGAIALFFTQGFSFKPIHNKGIAIALLASISLISYVAGKIQWVTPAGEPIKVALLQGNIPQEEKWLPEKRLPTLALYQKMTAENQDSDLIIWPETAIPGYFFQHVKDIIEPLQAAVINGASEMVIGGFHYVAGAKPDTENALLTITPQGREVYAKQHLVPLSEYMPLLDYLNWLRAWVQLPFDSVKQGEGSPLITVLGHKARASICYEDAYGVEMTKGLPEATLLINISNDGWFTGSIEPEQHMQIARMRAKETARYLIRSTNIGVSGIVDHQGKLLYTAPSYSVLSIKGLAVPYTGSTLFVRAGNWIIIPLLCLMILLTVFFNRSLINNKLKI